jgi:hypothetical protein
MAEYVAILSVGRLSLWLSGFRLASLLRIRKLLRFGLALLAVSVWHGHVAAKV